MELERADEIKGGDGLVAARHLWHYGYKPTIYYPKQSKNDLYQVRIISCPMKNS
jgi:NAD(P)H-hydrate repair Nnr-like enzyme with NAD(P)H-hydrate epimerase domain